MSAQSKLPKATDYAAPDYRENIERIDCVQQNTVLWVRLIRGHGTSESPIRQVQQFWSPDGKLLAERDPLAKITYPKPEQDYLNKQTFAE